MRVKDFVRKIEEIYPTQAALGFDNVGLLCGREEQLIESVYIALDVSEASIDAAITSGANLLVTHHPLLISPIHSITSSSITGRFVLKLIEHRISCYSLHTNYDILRMGELVGDLMGLEVMEVLDDSADSIGCMNGLGRVGVINEELTLRELANHVKKVLDLLSVRVYGDLNQSLDRIAVSPGSGKSMIQSAIHKKADVLITGDIGHHDALYALDNGLAIIDAGHYGTEYPFVSDLKQLLEGEPFGFRVDHEEIEQPFLTI